VNDCYRVLVVEDDPDPTAYLRLVLLRTGGPPGSDRAFQVQQPVRRPIQVHAMLKGVASTRIGVTGIGTSNTTPPIILIVEAAPDRREVLSNFFRRAGCITIAVPESDQLTSSCPPIIPDLLVLPEQVGPAVPQADTLRVRYPHCPVAITSVLDCVNHHQPRESLQHQR
jgi:CheY-like chemotaxis protein